LFFVAMLEEMGVGVMVVAFEISKRCAAQSYSQGFALFLVAHSLSDHERNYPNRSLTY